jgi:hypothetical protein
MAIPCSIIRARTMTTACVVSLAAAAAVKAVSVVRFFSTVGSCFGGVLGADAEGAVGGLRDGGGLVCVTSCHGGADTGEGFPRGGGGAISATGAAY